MEQNDLLSTGEQLVIPADKNLRFFNLLIDTVVYYLLSMLLGVLMALVAPEFLSRIANEEDVSAMMLWYAISILLYIAYFGVFEGMAKGKTIGKMITKTRAVKEDGTQISLGDAVKRSLCRIIPFEPFSALGNAPWHDSMTKTTVVKE